jgi:hypothetical protein
MTKRGPRLHIQVCNESGRKLVNFSRIVTELDWLARTTVIKNQKHILRNACSVAVRVNEDNFYRDVLILGG